MTRAIRRLVLARPDTGQEESLGLGRAPRDDDLQAGGVGEVRLRGLREKGKRRGPKFRLNR